jgi:outer membrane protein assembly factor BamB
LDRHTGKELWKAGSASEPGYCAPLIRTLGGHRQVTVWLADALMGLEPETGRVRWTIPRSLVAGMAITTPAIEGNRLAVSSQYEGVMMLEFKPGAAEPATVVKRTGRRRRWGEGG